MSSLCTAAVFRASVVVIVVFDCYKGEEKCRPYVRHRFLELVDVIVVFAS